MPTFKTKALRLVSNVQLDKCLLFVTKPHPSVISMASVIKKLKGIRTCLIGYGAIMAFKTIYLQ